MKKTTFLRKQITFTKYANGHITGTDNDGKSVTATIPDAVCYEELPHLLYNGCLINLLSGITDEKGTIHPQDIVVDPDYLLDISALARCVQPNGAPAIGYILNMLEQKKESAARLLGEAANIFLDDCVNSTPEQPASYKASMQRFFREYPLALCVCDNIDNTFFANTKEQFHNIQTRIENRSLGSTNNYNRENVYLEPSFFCEAMGLQGRIDLLQSDYNRLIELKSGKADEFNGGAKEEHRLQMSLYKEMLCHNLGLHRSKIRAGLFYSRYPRLYNDESSRGEISKALMLRNKIVQQLRNMSRDGLMSVLRNMNPEDLNERNNNSRLWTNYLRPRIEEILLPAKTADKLLVDYVFGNMAFVMREMLHAKASANSNGRSFADVWKISFEEKLENGNILPDLRIKEINDAEGIGEIKFSIPRYKEDFFPNFRAGDTVFVYRRNKECDKATNSLITRGTISDITPSCLTLQLRHKQRNRSLFPDSSLYAIEHDHLDSTFRTSLNNLYSLLNAPEQRTDLLLARREPQFTPTRVLNGNYGNEYINDIVLKAKQADELFMLVGPPGTGKTSQALKSMVREFISEENDILLASYTNRAVDEICQAIESISGKPKYIRIGSEHSCKQEFRHSLLKNAISHCQNREDIRKTLGSTRIFAGTIASLTANKELFVLKKFKVAIIDEASQILESQLAGLLAATSPDNSPAITKFILIGDPKQLPAVVAQPQEESIVKSHALQAAGIYNYGISLFERLYNFYYEKNVNGLLATLNRQGRMHPDVCDFANRHFYNKQLVPIPLPHQTELRTFIEFNSNNETERLISNKRAAFIATEIPPVESADKVNRNEAEKIALFVKSYCLLHKRNNIPCNPSKDIGIIVPFRNQIAMVAKAIAELDIPNCDDIAIDTVERFQGSQREMILFGTTIWKKELLELLSSPVCDASGNSIDRKLNVALTRARQRMYIFGNPDVLSASPIYKALMKELGN